MGNHYRAELEFNFVIGLGNKLALVKNAEENIEKIGIARATESEANDA